MKYPKHLLLLSLVIIFVLVAKQNLGILMHGPPLRFKLLAWVNQTAPVPLSVTSKVSVMLGIFGWVKQTAPIPLLVYFLGFFVVGLLLSSFCWLAVRSRTKKIAGEDLETIRRLERIKALKTMPAAEKTIPGKESETA
ncbi:MAG: hypothetical protein HWN68_11520 [Desulfobacterales bacterium]|nr:hypothetical protein [Desulfobacterales bacterium]